MTFPASRLMKQTIAAASYLVPRPVKNMATGHNRGPKHQKKEQHGPDKNGFRGKENGAYRCMDDFGGDRMQEDVLFPLPAQCQLGPNHDQSTKTAIRRQFARENPRAVFMAVDKDPVLNTSTNAIENSSFSGARLVPYSVLKAGRTGTEPRGHKGRKKQLETVQDARSTASGTYQHAGSWYLMDDDMFRTPPRKSQTSIHAPRATAFANQDSPVDHFFLQHLDPSHNDASLFASGPAHADPDSMDVDIEPLTTPKLSYEFWWRRDSLNNDVEMEEWVPAVQQEDVVMEDVQAIDHPGQDDIEMKEASPLLFSYPTQANLPIMPTSFPTGHLLPTVQVSNMPSESFDMDVDMDDALIYGEPMDVDVDSPAPNTLAPPSIQLPTPPSLFSNPPPSTIAMVPHCVRAPFTPTPPTPFSIQHLAPPSVFQPLPPFTTRMAPPYAGPVSSGPAYPPVMNYHGTLHIESFASGQGLNTPRPSPPSSQRRKTRHHRGTPPYTKTDICRDRALKSGPAGAHPRRRRSREPMTLGIESMFPQPPSLAAAPTASLFPNFPPSAITMAPLRVEPLIPTMPTPITPTPSPTRFATWPSVSQVLPSSTTTMAPHLAGPPPSCPTYPLVTNRHQDETSRAESLAIGLDTPSSPSPPSPRRRKIHRYQEASPYTPTPSVRSAARIALSTHPERSRRAHATSQTKKNALNGARNSRRL